ncbi:HipA domain-containing protein [Aeromicrobium sp. UC242_57]|uniref:HipA domain-containing protein n=1 Tax=Aeromicrobium sp. UC242_57 TaxID=3374624 RepID=UPI0037A7DB4D
MNLNVWLYGRHLATLTEPGRLEYRLEFTEEALDTFGQRRGLLSLSLPTTAKPLETRQVRNFLDGLLPEGQIRSEVARRAGVADYDVMGLLAQVGRECAGAVQVLEPGLTPEEGHLEPLSDDEVVKLVTELACARLGKSLAQHASLAGMQDKILLTRTVEGWAWPVEGAMSTHIVKPQPLGMPLDTLVLSEHWAMGIAAAAGLDVAETVFQMFEDRDAIVVTRYDRRDGQRVHQEDFCQALGYAPNDKYETDRKGPSRFSQIARIVRNSVVDRHAFRVDMLTAATFNVVIGNGDSHSKNYSLLISESGEARLAPLYDVAPTLHLNENYRNSGQRIGSKVRLDAITCQDLVDEAASWGMGVEDAAATVARTVEATAAAIHGADVPARLQKTVDSLRSFVDRRCVPGVLLP